LIEPLSPACLGTSDSERCNGIKKSLSLTKQKPTEDMSSFQHSRLHPSDKVPTNEQASHTKNQRIVVDLQGPVQSNDGVMFGVPSRLRPNNQNSIFFSIFLIFQKNALSNKGFGRNRVTTRYALDAGCGKIILKHSDKVLVP